MPGTQPKALLGGPLNTILSLYIILNVRRKRRSGLSAKAALQELKEALARMGEGPEVQTLREKLDCIFPVRKDD